MKYAGKLIHKASLLSKFTLKYNFFFLSWAGVTLVHVASLAYN